MRKLSTSLALAVLGTHASVVSAVTVQFDYQYDTNLFFDAGTDARDRLEDAGAFFESVLDDDLDAITPGGGNSWNARISNPTSGGPEFNIPNLVVPADTIIIYVGARNLGSGTLGEAGPGGFNATGSPAWFDTLFERGEGTGTTTGGSATDFAPWGGALSMNSTTNWDYSVDDSTIGVGEHHFYSVLIHEIAHVLGVGTSDSWDADVTAGQFTGAASVAEFGGNVPLDNPPGHWAEGTTSVIVGTNIAQETSMDPTIAQNTTKYWTELDNAALTDIGWEVIPEPSTGVLAILGFSALVTRRRR